MSKSIHIILLGPFSDMSSHPNSSIRVVTFKVEKTDLMTKLKSF